MGIMGVIIQVLGVLTYLLNPLTLQLAAVVIAVTKDVVVAGIKLEEIGVG